MHYRRVEAFEADPDSVLAEAEAGETIASMRNGVTMIRLEPVPGARPETGD